MNEEKTNKMREYLRLKEIEENDENGEIIEEIYNNIVRKEDKKTDER